MLFYGDKMMSCPHMDAQTNSDRAHSNRCITQHASISMQSPTTLRYTRVVWPHPLPVALPARGGWQLRPALTSMKVLFHTRAWMVTLVMTGASGMGHSSHTQWVWSLPQLCDRQGQRICPTFKFQAIDITISFHHAALRFCFFFHISECSLIFFHYFNGSECTEQ